jgi:hypothetical protein
MTNKVVASFDVPVRRRKAANRSGLIDLVHALDVFPCRSSLVLFSQISTAHGAQFLVGSDFL